MADPVQETRVLQKGEMQRRLTLLLARADQSHWQPAESVAALRRIQISLAFLAPEALSQGHADRFDAGSGNKSATGNESRKY